MIGRQHKHHPGVAGGRWKRRAPKTLKVFKPNLHAAHVMVGNNLKKVRLCTKCLRRARLAESKREKEGMKEKIVSVTAPIVSATAAVSI